MKKLLQEFKEFALRGNVMDLAVGVIIGAAFQAIINSLVNDVISPLIGLFANTDLTYLSVMVGDVEIRYGAFLTAVINFIIMAVIIFLMVKGMNALAGLGKKKEPEKPAVKMCPYCRSKVAAEATRCPYCTSMLEVKKEDKKDYFVFYVNNELTKVVAKKITLQHTSSGKAQVKELLKDLQTQPEDATLRRTIPRKVKIQNIDLISYQITVDFSKEYYDMKPTEEILTRAAIAKTLLQLSQYVTFTVDGKPLVDASGANVGAMNLDSFVENPGEQINSIQCTTLKLYFANETGDGLVEETRSDVYYSSNVSMEKLIMEQLLEGPQTEGAKSAIPAGTKLINVSVVDGVCYVSLDENFKNQDYQVNEAVVIYSIVDSLTELSTISKVQISVNGDTSGTYRDNFKLSDMYDRNLDYVVSLEETGVTEEE